MRAHSAGRPGSVHVSFVMALLPKGRAGEATTGACGNAFVPLTFAFGDAFQFD
jgi:hypothetical protein